MPSCSNSSNISSAINSLNITQGSAGSRFFVQVDKVNGLTAGDVIRWDVISQGYTASKADTPENSEVFGVIESYNPTTQKFNVVMSGSVSITNFQIIPTDPNGAGGGNDIYFLSGLTAGKLQNLAPSDINHVIKPVYQVAPHGSYTGTVINYSGYKLGGDVQAGLDTLSALSKLGSFQFVCENNGYISEEEIKFRNFGFDFTGTGIIPMCSLAPAVKYDWNLEHINVSNQNPTLVRYIDFKEFCEIVMPSFNGGWVERVKVDSTSPVFTKQEVVGKVITQNGHGGYNDTDPSTSWYGTVLEYDSSQNFLYILRPAKIDQELFRENNINGWMAETSVNSGSGAYMQIMSGTVVTDFGTQLYQIRITSTNRNIQLFGFVIPSIQVAQTQPPFTYPFYFQTFADNYNVQISELLEFQPRLYMRIKNRGLSLVIPDSVSVSGISSNTITLASQDLQTTINTLLQRIDCLERGQTCP